MTSPKIFLPTLFAAALLWALPGYGAKLNLIACVDDVPVIPYSYPDQEGLGQYLLRVAGERVGIKIDFVAQPRKRCLHNVKSGEYQIIVASGDTPSMREDYAFPMQGGQVDTKRALAATAAVFVTTAQNTVTWDGNSLLGAQGPVLIRAGIPTYEKFLNSKGLTWGSEVRSIDAVAKMLTAGRSDVALMRLDELRYLETQADYAKVLRKISPPAIEGYIYTVFNRELALTQAQAVNALWDEMLRIRSAPDWGKRMSDFYPKGE